MVKNKAIRLQVAKQAANVKKSEKSEDRKKRKRERKEEVNKLVDEHGLDQDAAEEVVAKKAREAQKTLENSRIQEETFVDADDEEIQGDDKDDEFSSIFQGETKPKVMITTRPKPSSNLFGFIRDLMSLMPNTFYYKRGSNELKKMAKWASKHNFTHLIVLGEKAKKCNQMLVSMLPQGPTALFKVSNVVNGSRIPGHGTVSDHIPELMLKHFRTRLGHRVGRFLGSLFPHQPEFHGRQIVAFHNQRDFIFVRHFRYMFKDSFDGARLQELGPRFTLKLRWIMAGSFDRRHGEMEWVFRRKDMDTNRRKFYL